LRLACALEIGVDRFDQRLAVDRLRGVVVAAGVRGELAVLDDRDLRPGFLEHIPDQTLIVRAVLSQQDAAIELGRAAGFSPQVVTL